MEKVETGTCEVCGSLFDSHLGDRACNFYCYIALKGA